MPVDSVFATRAHRLSSVRSKLRAPSHPSPLPQGEGESQAARPQRGALALSKEVDMILLSLTEGEVRGGAGMLLTTFTSVAPSALWSSVTNTIQSTGAIFYATIPLEPAPAGFYRLQQ